MNGRDSERTRNRIVDALETILLEKGFPGVGVNAVAREAGVDKVLLYRYFGSMEGLLSEFRKRRERCVVDIDHILSEAPENSTLADIAVSVALGIFRKFREDRIAREIARWELTESNPLTVSFVRSVEEKQLQVVRDLNLEISDDTVYAMTTVISGLIFLVLRQSVKKPVLSLDLDDTETVAVIEKNVGDLIRGYFCRKENGE